LRQKSIGVAEERFLFAQLLAAAPQVTLSCSEQDARGKEIHPSSLLVELQLEGVLSEPEPVHVSHRPCWEVGVERGLVGGKVADVLGVGGASSALVQLTATRHGALPAFAGEVGPASLDADPRHRDVFVTAIEAIARCPWNAFLTRYLGIRERPDPLGPLPSVSVHLLGRVVHMVVERVVAAAVGEEARDSASEAVPMTWPSVSTLEEWILDAARTCLQADGVAWRGFALAVVNPAKAAIDVLRGLDDGLEGVWAAEAEFRVQTSGGHSVGFMADRLDVVDGRATITDFKLGRAPTDHKKPETRAAKILAAVRSGKLLQGALYARAMDNAVGRYLYLHPDHELPVREFVFSGDDAAIQESMDAVIGEVCSVIATGSFFPRVSEAGEDRIPVACKYCAVREACVVEDSGMRRGVMALSAAGPESPTSNARRALWWRGLEPSS
jgi:RecB family exonuclease